MGQNGECRVIKSGQFAGKDGSFDPRVLAGFLGIDEKDIVNTGDAETRNRLDQYKKNMEDGDILEGMRFTQLEKSEGMWFWDGEIKVFMPATEHLCYRPDKPEDAYVAGRWLDRSYNVKVIGVDYDAKTVSVSYYEAQETIRAAFEKAITDSLAKGIPFRTKAIVNNIQSTKNAAGDILSQRKLQLSVGGVGTNGYLWVDDWSENFTPTLEGLVSVGDVIDVAVVEQLPKATYKGHVGFKCSRKLVEPSPWNRIKERFSRLSVVMVTCVEPMNEKHRDYFWGSLAGIPGMCFLCRLASDVHIPIYKGLTYRGTITTFKPDDKKLIVTIFNGGNERGEETEND